MNNDIVIEDINLVDNSSPTGGKEWAGETLSEFVTHLKCALGREGLHLAEINSELEECGIEPITEDQIWVRGVESDKESKIKVACDMLDGLLYQVKSDPGLFLDGIDQDIISTATTVKHILKERK